MLSQQKLLQKQEAARLEAQQNSKQEQSESPANCKVETQSLEDAKQEKKKKKKRREEGKHSPSTTREKNSEPKDIPSKNGALTPTTTKVWPFMHTSASRGKEPLFLQPIHSISKRKKKAHANDDTAEKLHQRPCCLLCT
jgi:hypothetical protein